MADIVLTGDTSGSITVAAPAVAGSNTLTLPASTGTVVTSNSPASDLPSTIAGPAFSSTKSGSGDQPISANTTTKVTFETEQWDLTNDYDTSNSRFTPSVQGYYHFNSAFYFKAPTDGSVVQIQLYKNGSVFKWGNILTSAGTSSHSPNLSATAYANGTTDYFEIYIWQNSGTKSIEDVGTLTWFDGHLVRAA